MSNSTYDKIKTVSLLIAPAIVFFTALVDIWGIPYGSQIVCTLAALDVLAGAVTTVLKAQYDKKQEVKK